ncbi:DUF4258 domain-containing protein [Desulfobacula sp.]|uniref:DUF4258 domain-containing protein n=1 Tax=Desulfobacula sp. TaxID=2593537 RepID=UPI001EC7F968|nr:DUF4258 domain-containing protein [Desulfobacula sp.]
MTEPHEIFKLIRSAAKKHVFFLPHAVHQMTRPERMITTAEIRSVIGTGEIIEAYPNDPRGNSYLLLGFGSEGRPVHVVCAPKKEYLAIITAYLPDAREWSDGFRRRKKT